MQDDDLGVVLDRIDEAALPEGRPLDTTTPPEPADQPAELVRRWSRWADGGTRPYDGVPDVLSARWLVLAHCHKAGWTREGGELSPFEVAAAARAAAAAGADEQDAVEPHGFLSPRERMANARRAVLEPSLELPPLENLRPSPVTPEGVVSAPYLMGIDTGRLQLLRWVLEGPDAALAWYASTPRDIDRWAATPVMRALLRSGGAQPPVIAPPTTPARRLQASALAATPAEHAALLAETSLDDVALLFNRQPVITLPILVSLALPLDADGRRALLDRLDAHDEDGVRKAISWNGDAQATGLALAMFGTTMFERMVTEALALPRLGKAASLGARVSGPAAVGGMLRIAAAGTESSPEARAWLTAHPAAVAAYDGHPEAEGARHHVVLADVAREHAMADATYDPAHPVAAGVAARVHEVTALPGLDADALPAWWTAAVAAEAAAPVTVKVAKKLPESTPALRLRVVDGDAGGGAVRVDGPMAEEVLVSALASDPTDGPRPLAAAVVDRMRAVERDEAGGIVLRSWRDAGAPVRDARLLVAAGFLGADGVVAEVATQVNRWVQERDTKRAVLGLEVLAAAGSAASLQALAGVAATSRAKKLKEEAEGWLARLAARQGLTSEELADRVVPDLGLDARGVRVLDYGERRFRVALGADGKPVVHALGADGRPTGKAAATLPPARAADDPERVEDAKDAFKQLRTQFADVVSIQTARLEQALVTGRVWTADDHAAFVLRHPVMGTLVRALVWRVEGPDGVALVRVDEGEYLTVDGDPFEPAAGATFALAHPLDVDEPTRAAWQQHLLDHDLQPPVEQLTREVRRLPDGQSGVDLADLPAGTLPPTTLLGVVQKQGWRQAAVTTRALRELFVLAFPPLGVTALLQVTGLTPGRVQDSDVQEVRRVVVAPIGAVGPETEEIDEQLAASLLDWRKVPPRVVSEVRRSLDALATRMEA
jgi:hypothetical protein